MRTRLASYAAACLSDKMGIGLSDKMGISFSGKIRICISDEIRHLRCPFMLQMSQVWIVDVSRHWIPAFAGMTGLRRSPRWNPPFRSSPPFRTSQFHRRELRVPLGAAFSRLSLLRRIRFSL